MSTRDNQRQAQWAEALFVARATAEGLNVSKPWGVYRYDFLVERGGHAWRVQVKSCRYRRYNRSYYCAHQANRQKRYTADEFDFFAIYIVPEEVWYVLPFACLAPIGDNVMLSPKSPNSKYYRYLEAWHLLRSPDRERATGTATASRARASA